MSKNKPQQDTSDMAELDYQQKIAELEAKKIAAELIEVVSKNKVTSVDGEDFYCEISAGVSTYKNQDEWKDVLHEADQALLESKSKGKCQVTVYKG